MPEKNEAFVEKFVYKSFLSSHKAHSTAHMGFLLIEIKCNGI
jgi:hypothetical protein